jgi:hypothetical protein
VQQTPKTPKPKKENARAVAVRNELKTIDVLKELVAGYRPPEIAERLKLPYPEVKRRIEQAFAALREEKLWMAGLALDVRLARLDRIIVAFSEDLENMKPSVRMAAAREIRETELARDRILLGAKQVERIDKELRAPVEGEAGTVKSASVTFVRRGQERPAHVEPRTVEDPDGL